MFHGLIPSTQVASPGKSLLYWLENACVTKISLIWKFVSDSVTCHVHTVKDILRIRDPAFEVILAFLRECFYLHCQSTFGHQAWQDVNLPQGFSNLKVTWTFDHMVLRDRMTNKTHCIYTTTAERLSCIMKWHVHRNQIYYWIVYQVVLD